MQYVRDYLEDLFRIVAIVSMPQTAFTANGAGVKSSVLFLRKNKLKTTENISAKKQKIKTELKTDNKFVATLEKWEKEKNAEIKKLEEETKKKKPEASKKEIADLTKDKKAKLQATYMDKVNLLKAEMMEKYFAAKQKALEDYQIFMAIAEDIGYDATGRQTGKNELLAISKELSRFIQHIETTE